MAEETLLSAARRVVRFFNGDMAKGGIIREDTQIAIDTLDRMVRREDAAEKRREDRANIQSLMGAGE